MKRKKNKKVLLIEDAESNILLFKNILEIEGYDVAFAQSAEQAFDILKKDNFNLILLDLMIGKFDGFDVLNKITQNKKTAKIPVIMISAYDFASNIKKAKQLGASDFLAKPIEVPDFIKKVEVNIN